METTLASPKSFKISLCVLFYFLFFVLLLFSGIAAAFAGSEFNHYFWLKVSAFIFKFLFPDIPLFIIGVIAFSLGGIALTIPLYHHKKWARFVFSLISLPSFVWIIFRVFISFNNAPGFVSIKGILSNNPITQGLSLYYFGVAAVLMILEVFLFLVLAVLLNPKNNRYFS
jgi:hypothetical protein